MLNFRSRRASKALILTLIATAAPRRRRTPAPPTWPPLRRTAQPSAHASGFLQQLLAQRGAFLPRPVKHGRVSIGMTPLTNPQAGGASKQHVDVDPRTIPPFLAGAMLAAGIISADDLAGAVNGESYP